jgi:hypothetical protein
MSGRRIQRVSAAQFNEDYIALVALRDMTHLSEKAPDLLVEKINEHYHAAVSARENVLRLQQALKNARDVQMEHQIIFHEDILNAKDRIISVFGRDSMEVQKIGLKRKSEYRRPTRRAKQT